ncbi:MAG: thymidylate kinase [Firmicutes bacterium]|nr:thymidylate kinase [Bacillota bacterium]
MNGKLIVIESGTDSSGKATQTDKLYQRLKKESYNIKKIQFPDYQSRSSELVKMYLNGEFGSKPGDVNSYAASTFYAVDRYASYQLKWKKDYQDGKIILADRYTTSNMVHQASKIKDLKEKEEYLDWLYDLEFNRFLLPEPDLVIFLDVPPEKSRALMDKRAEGKDIHEQDINYLSSTYDNACWLAEKYKWQVIDCVRGNIMRTVEEIHEEIYDLFTGLMES